MHTYAEKEAMGKIEPKNGKGKKGLFGGEKEKGVGKAS